MVADVSRQQLMHDVENELKNLRIKRAEAVAATEAEEQQRGGLANHNNHSSPMASMSPHSVPGSGGGTSPILLETSNNGEQLRYEDLARRRATHLTNAEVQDAVRAYFSFPSVFFPGCYRLVVNMMSFLGITPIPSEEALLSSLALVGFTKNSMAAMSFFQWQLFLDGLKAKQMTHADDDDGSTLQSMYQQLQVQQHAASPLSTAQRNLQALPQSKEGEVSVQGLCYSTLGVCAMSLGQWLSFVSHTKEGANDEDESMSASDAMLTHEGDADAAAATTDQRRQSFVAQLRRVSSKKALETKFKDLFVSEEDVKAVLFEDRRDLLRLFLSLGATDPDYRGSASVEDMLLGCPHDHFLGDDWWQALWLPVQYLEYCALLVLPDDVDPKKNEASHVDFVTSSSSSSSGTVPSEYVEFLRRKLVSSIQGGGIENSKHRRQREESSEKELSSMCFNVRPPLSKAAGSTTIAPPLPPPLPSASHPRQEGSMLSWRSSELNNEPHPVVTVQDQSSKQNITLHETAPSVHSTTDTFAVDDVGDVIPAVAPINETTMVFVAPSMAKNSIHHNHPVSDGPLSLHQPAIHHDGTATDEERSTNENLFKDALSVTSLEGIMKMSSPTSSQPSMTVTPQHQHATTMTTATLVPAVESGAPMLKLHDAFAADHNMSLHEISTVESSLSSEIDFEEFTQIIALHKLLIRSHRNTKTLLHWQEGRRFSRVAQTAVEVHHAKGQLLQPSHSTASLTSVANAASFTGGITSAGGEMNTVSPRHMTATSPAHHHHHAASLGGGGGAPGSFTNMDKSYLSQHTLHGVAEAPEWGAASRRPFPMGKQPRQFGPQVPVMGGSFVTNSTSDADRLLERLEKLEPPSSSRRGASSVSVPVAGGATTTGVDLDDEMQRIVEELDRRRQDGTRRIHSAGGAKFAHVRCRYLEPPTTTTHRSAGDDRVDNTWSSHGDLVVLPRIAERNTTTQHQQQHAAERPPFVVGGLKIDVSTKQLVLQNPPMSHAVVPKPPSMGTTSPPPQRRIDNKLWFNTTHTFPQENTLPKSALLQQLTSRHEDTKTKDEERVEVAPPAPTHFEEDVGGSTIQETISRPSPPLHQGSAPIVHVPPQSASSAQKKISGPQAPAVFRRFHVQKASPLSAALDNVYRSHRTQTNAASTSQFSTPQRKTHTPRKEKDDEQRYTPVSASSSSQQQRSPLSQRHNKGQQPPNPSEGDMTWLSEEAFHQRVMASYRAVFLPS